MSLFAAVPRRLFFLAAGVLLSTGCGESLSEMTEQAMDQCIATRNPLFTSGRGAEALDTPLSAETEALAQRFHYVLAYRIFKDIAEEAGSQVVLVCALDLASRYNDPESKKFIAKYANHPDAAVATSAQRLTR